MLLCPWDLPGKDTGLCCYFLLQGILLTQGLNPRLPELAGGFFTTEPPQGSPKAPSAFLIGRTVLSLVTQSCPTLCIPMDCNTPGLPIHHQLHGPNSCSSSWWCRPTISSSVISFSSRLQSLPASGSFYMSQFFTLVLPINIQDWFPLEWTGWISLQSKGLSRVFSNTTVQKHQFFSAQLSL